MPTSSATLADRLVRQGWIIQSLLPGLGADFRSGHREYLTNLRASVSAALTGSDAQELLAELGLDWLTLHYKSTHPFEDWEDLSPWLQVALPIADYFKIPPRSDAEVTQLRVYERGISPYIEQLSRSLLDEGEPIRVYIHGADEVPAQEVADHWLCVGGGLAGYLQSITRGCEREGPLSEDEAAECLRLDAAGVERIHAYLGRWYAAQRPADSLGLLRDSCRFTLLALKLQISEVHYPRCVILVPLYIGGNLIGGLSFVGTRQVEHSLTLLLSTFAVALLTGLRLREEPEREAAIHEVEELNLAREDFIRNITHSVQNPVDSVQLGVQKAKTLLGQLTVELDGLVDQVEQLRRSADGIIYAFTSRNPNEFLVPKQKNLDLEDVLSTIAFINSGSFAAANKQLVVDEVPDGLRVRADMDMLLDALDNVVKNGMRFARSAVTISASRQPQSHMVAVAVRDDGEGVSQGLRESLFKPGATGNPARGRSHGFGLYLARSNMRRQGGDIRFVGEGAVPGAEFVVEIPESIE
jgi:signal transduction histidine kinase